MSAPGGTLTLVSGVRKCLNCEAELVSTGGRGRPRSWCSAVCRNRSMYLRRLQRGGRGFQPCSICSKHMQVTPTMAAIPTCLSCRQQRKAARAAAKAEQAAADVGPWSKVCIYEDCQKLYLAEKKTRRFCSTECFLASHRAQERIRDAERRRRRREEVPVPALLWRGDEEANALIAGPPAEVTQVFLRTEPGGTWGRSAGIYSTRCPLCGWLTLGLEHVETNAAWGCDNCYTKIVLITPPSQEPDPYRRRADVPE